MDLIFGVPDEENLDVVERLRTSSIKLTVSRHEQAARTMACVSQRENLSRRHNGE